MIEAPRDGDPIFTLQKGFNQISAGRIYVRRHGKTIEASPADVRLLETRSSSKTEKVNLEVTACDPDAELQPLRFSAEDRDGWLKDERARLAPPAPRGNSASLYEIPLPESLEDSRGRSGFQKAVSAYFNRAELRWYGLVIKAGISTGSAALKLQIENSTERNFTGVEVVVEIPDVPNAWLDESEVFEAIEAPDPPKSWGTHSVADSIRVDPLPIGLLDPDNVERDGGIKIRFDSRHLRPGQILKLPDIHLTIPASRAGEEISLHWRLTAADANGWRDGDMVFRISDEPFTPELASQSAKRS
jgi:hypothetical protein